MNRTIHQFHYTVSDHDAVGNHLRLIQRALRQEGIGGEIFACEDRTHGATVRRFVPGALSGADLVLVHHSQGNPALDRVLAENAPKALLYHNITPENFFRHDPYVAELSRLGRQQLHAFHGKVVAAFGDSRFNCAELRVMGFSHAEVFPLLDLDPTPAVPSPKVSGLRRLTFVGRIAHHKNQAFLVEVLAELERAFPGHYELWLAGKADPLYGTYLSLLAKARGVSEIVNCRSGMNETQLRALYASSHAFVCASLHEGFCVPLVEAMQAGLPVFALPTTGIRGTLGHSGIRMANRSPRDFAHTIHATLGEPEAVETTVQGQAAQLGELARWHNAARIRTLCASLMPGQAAPPTPEGYL
ncbi:glycosyltransferase family 4 protein [bacterium]|nr:glycosyltransferase family 4 protein [bacterium]